ncbi:MAG: HPr family phosphocarrier protein [Geminicoccaceae bacterium]
MSAARTASSSVVITHATGLHARPAVKFTKLAKTFSDAEIRIRGADDKPWIDAKSIVKVMALKLRSGSTLQMTAEGSEAEAAIAALKELVEDDFGESEKG